MKKYKVQLAHLSPQLEDGSRKTLKTDIIATCSRIGDAELITALLREQKSYKELLQEKADNKHIFILSVGY